MKKILLVGFANAGKSTVFSSLTKKRSHIGNWSGVTTQLNSQIINVGEPMMLVDLPGISGLVPYSNEESVTINEILKSDGIVLNVIDCFSLKRSLGLTMQLLEIGCKVIIYLSFYDEYRAKFGNVVGLEKLNCPIISSAKNLKNELKNAILSVEPGNISLPTPILAIKRDIIATDEREKTYLAFRKYEENSTNIEQLYTFRNNFISSIVKQNHVKEYGLNKWDKYLLSSYKSLILFLGGFIFIFWLAFGEVGSLGKDLVSLLLDKLWIFIGAILTKMNAPVWVESFLSSVVIDGVGSILSFLPALLILFLGMEILEQSGLIARIVWLFEPLCNRLGVVGKSIFVFLIGFGCTTTAVPLSGTIKNRQMREKTIFSLNYIPCSAKLPVLVSLATLVFLSGKIWVVLGMYLLSICVGLLLCLCLKRERDFGDLRDLNPLRIPRFRLIMKLVFQRIGDFLKRIYKVILGCACIIWFLCHFSFDLVYQSNITNDCALVKIAQLISWVFYPLGLEWPYVCALILGFPAKELSLVGVSMLSSGLGESIISFEPVVCISFLSFFILYTPCISALRQISCQLKIWPFILVNFLIAYLITSVVHLVLLCASACGVSVVWAFVLSVLVFLAIEIMFVCKGRCKGNCGSCGMCG